MTEFLQRIDAAPTDREIIRCITAACEMPDGQVKWVLLRELTNTLAKINSPLHVYTTAVSGSGERCNG